MMPAPMITVRMPLPSHVQSLSVHHATAERAEREYDPPADPVLRELTIRMPLMSSLPRNMHTSLRKAEHRRRAKALVGENAYSCFLDEGAHAAGEAPAAPDDGLIVNATFLYQTGPRPPAEIERRPLPLHSFLAGYPIAWVQHPATEVWAPFWADEKWAEVLQSLRPGLRAPSGLDAAIVRVLAASRILVPADYMETTRARWEETCRLAKAGCASDGYAVVSEII